jgi:hypothetical protein
MASLSGAMTVVEIGIRPKENAAGTKRQTNKRFSADPEIHDFEVTVR